MDTDDITSLLRKRGERGGESPGGTRPRTPRLNARQMMAGVVDYTLPCKKNGGMLLTIIC